MTPLWMPVAIMAALMVPALSQSCDKNTCPPPDCRCWDDRTAPGGLDTGEVPQIVMVTMENAINDDNVDEYTSLFNIVNPNGCAIRGTFFVEDEFTDYKVVQTLSEQGHEIGINTLKGSNPTDQEEWVSMYKTIKGKLTDRKIDEKSIIGARADGFALGGNDQLSAEGDNSMVYDSSCVSTSWSTKSTFVWPFTFDFPAPACNIGQAPDLAYPGYWEFPIADLKDLTPEKRPCAAPSACAGVKTKTDAFDLFFQAFEEHLTGGRSPFMMVIDPTWAKNTELREGTIEFLDYITAAFPDDVWIVPVSKALDWIKDPTPLSNITDFKPWGCS